LTREEGATMAKILYLGTSGSDDPTRAGFPFQWALGARDAGHDAEIFLAGEATYLMRKTLADSVLPVAMPPLRELIDEVVAQRVPIFV
jgi:predicted peroxiredoxin